MTSQEDFVRPPRIASWLVNLFAAGEEVESLLGDMLEEVHSRPLGITCEECRKYLDLLGDALPQPIDVHRHGRLAWRIALPTASSARSPGT